MSLHDDLFGELLSRKGINVNVKGAGNERALAHALTAWSGAEWVRVPRSGGLRWRNRSEIVGDVISTNPDYRHFVVEAKFYKAYSISEQLRANSVFFTKFKQAEDDAKAVGKVPLLFMRMNSMPASTWHLALSTEHITTAHIRIMPIAEGGHLQVYDSAQFFEHITYEDLSKSIL